jgi:hypothetical protein
MKGTKANKAIKAITAAKAIKAIKPTTAIRAAMLVKAASHSKQQTHLKPLIQIWQRWHLWQQTQRTTAQLACNGDREKADSTLRSSQAVPHPSTNRALCRLTSEVRRNPVHSTWWPSANALHIVRFTKPMYGPPACIACINSPCLHSKLQLPELPQLPWLP